jgi:hypothetical protein
MPAGADGRGTEGALLSADEVAETAAWVASLQLADGMVPWYRGGHADPWNHVEAAMALAAAGRRAEVERAFAWLEAKQLEEGSWCASYVPGGVLEPHRDPNACAYVATGAWWCHEVGFGRAFLERWWPMIERALRWCLRQQLAGGEVAWCVGPDGVRANWALLAANSSVHLSWRCAAEIARALGEDPSPWDRAAARVASAVARSVVDGGRAMAPGATTDRWAASKRQAGFAQKERWAMDWYYPALTGALCREAGRRRLLARWGEFVVPGLGVRCVSDRLWVTAAETAEGAMAAWRAGLASEAKSLLGWARHLRHPRGAYWTGCAHPECRRFPGGQLSTYSAGAVLIADHVLSGRSRAARIFASSFAAPGANAEPEADIK